MLLLSLPKNIHPQISTLMAALFSFIIGLKKPLFDAFLSITTDMFDAFRLRCSKYKKCHMCMTHLTYFSNTFAKNAK